MCTAFVGGVPTLPGPRWASCRRARSGAAVEAWDEDGQPADRSGRRAGHHRADAVDADLLLGRRVGRALPRELLRDVPGRLAPRRLGRDHARTAAAVIYGRSDSTINRGGVRIGTSEIYRVVLALDEVRRRAGRRPAAAATATAGWSCSSCSATGAELTDELLAAIRRRLRDDCSPRHVPDEIVQIAEVPRTLSGKLLEVPVKRILMGTAGRNRAASRESLANPEQRLDAVRSGAAFRPPPRGRGHRTGARRRTSYEALAVRCHDHAGTSSSRSRKLRQENLTTYDPLHQRSFP